jgi:uncharacterized membrane protein
VIDSQTMLAIVLMASSTYLTRVMGYIALRNRTLSPRMMAVLENVPGCVLIAVIAPAFVSNDPANLLALSITLLAAIRLSILPTVLIGICATGLLRHFIG